MKTKILLIISLSTLLSFKYLYCQGVDFKPISIKEGIMMAKEENKNLFVLFGTTHCGYSRQSFVELSKDKDCGSFMNKHFISIGYGDSTATNEIVWFNSKTRSQLNLVEDEWEAVFCNYFIFPNYFFFDRNGDIAYINAAPKNPKKILKYAQFVEQGKVKTPLFFRLKFNNKMYPKRKSTYKMLSHCLQAYLLMNIPENIDYKNDSIYSLVDFGFDNDKLDTAKDEIENSLSVNDYYFNCFLASMIYDSSNDSNKAIYYAKKGLNEYEEHWDASRNLTDKLMREIIDKHN